MQPRSHSAIATSARALLRADESGARSPAIGCSAPPTAAPPSPARCLGRHRDLPHLRSTAHARTERPSQSGVMTTADRQAQLEPRRVVAHHRSSEVGSSWSPASAAQPFQSWAWGELKSHFGWQPFRLSCRVTASSVAQLLVRPYRGLVGRLCAARPGDAATAAAPASSTRPIDHPPSPLAARRIPALRAGRARGRPWHGRSPRRRSKSAGFRTAERTLQPRSSIRLDLRQRRGRAVGRLLEGPSGRHPARRARRRQRPHRDAPRPTPTLLHACSWPRPATQVVRLPQRGLLPTSCWQPSATRPAAHRRARRRASRRQLARPRRGRHGTYLAAGSTAAGLEHRAAHLLQWHAIRWAKERGAQTWDMWGIADARGRYELALADGARRRVAEMDAARGRTRGATRSMASIASRRAGAAAWCAPCPPTTGSSFRTGLLALAVAPRRSVNQPCSSTHHTRRQYVRRTSIEKRNS